MIDSKMLSEDGLEIGPLEEVSEETILKVNIITGHAMNVSYTLVAMGHAARVHVRKDGKIDKVDRLY